MTNFKKLIKLFICLQFILAGLNANAQIAILQHTIDQLSSYKNFSYQYVYKQKEVFSDTLICSDKFVLLKAPEDKEFGYLFRYEFKYDNMKVPSIDQYNGKNLTSIHPVDSTYYTSSNRNAQVITYSQSLPGQLNLLKTFSEKNPSKLIQSSDTIFHSINSYHLILTTRDTIINKDHIYAKKHFFIDKLTGFPVAILSRSRTADYGKEVTNYYTEDSYFNYKINQDSINTDYFVVPKGFHLPVAQPKELTTLLPTGKIAPDWTLYDTEGKKTSLSQLKGKIVILDFFFVGCTPCLKSLVPLDKIHEKYKNTNLVILSISSRDNLKLVKTFKESEHIKYQMYPNGSDVVKLYHVTGFPTLYIIDQEGKISSLPHDNEDDLEKNMSAAIDNLIKKS